MPFRRVFVKAAVISPLVAALRHIFALNIRLLTLAAVSAALAIQVPVAAPRAPPIPRLAAPQFPFLIKVVIVPEAGSPAEAEVVVTEELIRPAVVLFIATLLDPVSAARPRAAAEHPIAAMTLLLDGIITYPGLPDTVIIKLLIPVAIVVFAQEPLVVIEIRATIPHALFTIIEDAGRVAVALPALSAFPNITVLEVVTESETPVLIHRPAAGRKVLAGLVVSAIAFANALLVPGTVVLVPVFRVDAVQVFEVAQVVEFSFPIVTPLAVPLPIANPTALPPALEATDIDRIDPLVPVFRVVAVNALVFPNVVELRVLEVRGINRLEAPAIIGIPVAALRVVLPIGIRFREVLVFPHVVDFNFPIVTLAVVLAFAAIETALPVALEIIPWIVPAVRAFRVVAVQVEAPAHVVSFNFPIVTPLAAALLIASPNALPPALEVRAMPRIELLLTSVETLLGATAVHGNLVNAPILLLTPTPQVLDLATLTVRLFPNRISADPV